MRQYVRFYLFLQILFLSAPLVFAYKPLTSEQYSSFLSDETRKVFDLSGSWQVIEDGVAVSNIPVPSHILQHDFIRLRKTVRMDAQPLSTHTWHLHLLGALDEVELYVNGRYVMRYPGGMAPFSIRIPDGLLRVGANTIDLGVTKTSGITYKVHQFAKSSEALRMGLLREAFLVGTPQIWTEDIKLVSSVRQGVGSLNVKARINSGQIEQLVRQQSTDGLTINNANVAVEAQLIDRSTKQVVASSGAVPLSISRSREVVQSLNLTVYNPSLWSVSSPYVYDLVIRIQHNGVTLDSYKRLFGFRSVGITTVDGVRRFTLNDSTIRIYAVDYVEYFPALGASMTYDQFLQDVSLLKTLGVNAIRIRHSMPHPVLLDLCDRYGILVMVDSPTADAPSGMLRSNELTTAYRNAAQRICSYVDSHPSVIAIGISDGLDETSSAVSDFHRNMLRLYRSLTNNALYKVVPANQLGATSEGGFDFLVFRFASLSDSTVFRTLRQDVARMFRSVAILTEFGTPTSPSNFNGFNDPISTEAQALYISKFFQWTVNSALAGMVVWSFNDYELERPTMLVDHFDSRISTSGLVDVFRHPRISFEVYKALINDEKLPLLQARDSFTSTPIVFIIAGLLIALAIAFTANQSRRFREYVVRAVLRPYNFYADIRDQRILSIVQTSLLGFVIASSVGLVLSSFFFFIRTDAKVEYLMHILFPGDGSYELLRFISWHPEMGILVWTLTTVTVLAFVALLLRIGAMFVKGRIYFRDTYTIVIWSSLPLIALLPLGIGLYQALSANQLSVIVPIVIFVLALWSFLRILEATAVVFDTRSVWVYSIGLGVVIIQALIAILSWNAANNGFAFLGHYLSVVL